jgi:hypothetical protein
VVVIFKELKKRVNLETTAQQSRILERLQNKPFWIWNIEEHRQEDIKTNGECCFNHIIGLPLRNGMDKPLYDYEKIILDIIRRKTRRGNGRNNDKQCLLKVISIENEWLVVIRL